MMRRDAQTAIRSGNAVSGEAYASKSSRVKHGKLAGDITIIGSLLRILKHSIFFTEIEWSTSSNASFK